MFLLLPSLLGPSSSSCYHHVIPPAYLAVNARSACYNLSLWNSSAPTGPVLPSYQPNLEADKRVDLGSCAAACHLAELTVAGVDDGKHCFCGTGANLGTLAAKALVIPKAECSGVPCQGRVGEKNCGGAGAMLAYQFSCDVTGTD